MEKIQEYIEVVTTLSEILAEENKLLSALKFDDSAALLERKTKAINIYKASVSYMIENAEMVNSLGKDDREYIKEISVTLNDLIKENDLILRTKMEVSKSVMDAIVGMLKKSNISNSTSYGAMGTLNPLEKSRNAITINQTL